MAPGVSKQTAEPPWLSPLRAELERLDPRWLVIYDTYREHFLGDASPARIRRHLIAEGCRWVPTERWIRRWMNESILRLEGEFKTRFGVPPLRRGR